MARRRKLYRALATYARHPLTSRPKPRTMATTIFDKIVSKEIPAKIIWEDEAALAFRDISPVAPSHILVIPKVRGRLSQLSKATEEDKGLLGHLFWAASHVARLEGLAERGFRVVVNDGPEGCQSVYHLHLHVIGGEQLTWPPGTQKDAGSMKG